MDSSSGTFFITCINLYLERYPQYVYSYINCGMKQPIAVRNWGPSDIEYMESGDKNYPSPNMFISYVCTEKEALELGAKHVPSGERSDYYEY